MLAALSPSRAGDFMQCPLLYRFRTLDRLPEPPSPAAARGTLVHSVLEHIFDVPAHERTLENAVDLLPQRWDDLVRAEPELAPLAGATPEELTTWLRGAEKLVERWFTMENPQFLEPAERECFVQAQIDGLTLRGYIDRLDVAPTGQVRVVDYKTGRSPGEGFEGRALFQMKFYALVLWRTRGEIPTLLQLVYLGNGEFVRYAPEAAELEALERKLKALWRAIQTATDTGDWRPRKSRLCSWCSFKEYCPEWGGTPPPLPVQSALLDMDTQVTAMADEGTLTPEQFLAHHNGAPQPTWSKWSRVGCGVESLHHVLQAWGVDISLDDALAQALSEDGFDPKLGWRHRALVMVAARNGVKGEIRGQVTLDDLQDGHFWLASVNAPEQFECSHLIAVRFTAEGLEVFWPQGHPEFGERFVADAAWLGAKLTGRGMRYEQPDQGQ